MMDKIFNILLILHVVGGCLGLLTGLINILRRKGDKPHKLIGKIFYFSMLIAGISSVALAYLHLNYFLFMVGVYTLYMVSSGQFYLIKHKQSENLKIKRIVWIITILMLLSGLLFVGIGVLICMKLNLFGIVFITFGSLGLLFVQQDFRNYRDKATIKNYWLIGHLQRMTGSFIASLTAFLVVNAQYFPNQIPRFAFWLLPTVILTPLIIKWSKQYETFEK